MRRLSVAIALACLASVVGADASSAREDRGVAPSTSDAVSRLPDAPRPAFVPGRVLVTFAPRTSSVARERALGLVRTSAAQALVPRRDVWLVSIPRRSDSLAVSSRLERSSAVVSAEPDWYQYALEVVPNDPFFSQQWGLRNVGQEHAIFDPPPETTTGLPDADADVSDAWDVTMGSSDVVIADLDTGAELTHPDLAPSLWTNPGEVAGNGVDDDGNGYVDDVNGFDFVAPDGDPEDPVGHGTHTAGIIGAAANDGIGVAGVCPACKLMILRAGDARGRFTLSAEVAAIAYAVDNGARIINMSVGGIVWSSSLRNAIERAGANGTLVVAASGNGLRDNDKLYWRGGFPIPPVYPASYDLPNVLSVAATNDHDEYGSATGCSLSGDGGCGFSNWGHTSTDVGAPGVDILSTYLFGSYQMLDGTSMAAPFVSGIAGLVASVNPTYGPVQIKDAIMNSVDRPAALAGGRTVTNGRVNALGALTASTGRSGSAGDGTMAGAVGIHRRTSGRLSSPTDVNDIYAARLRRGKTYAALLTVPARSDFDLYVWKPGATDTWPIDFGCRFSCQAQTFSVRGRGKPEYVQFKARKSGIYYFHVTMFGRRAGSYVLTVGVPASR